MISPSRYWFKRLLGILRGGTDAELQRLVRFYDYLEIQPLGNDMFMLRDEKSTVKTVEDLKEDVYKRQKVIRIGDKVIGGGNPVLIQSMCNTKTEDVEATVDQILKLEAAGCDIIRVAVPTMEAADAIRRIKREIHIPLVADCLLYTSRCV